ncbi:MAG: hypothetical protein H8D55_02595 [Deltaproteobacteria bacterium]|nr:hypothetical protein [Deltaproteobacteria bacterium]
MSSEKVRRQIASFLNGKGNRNIDAFSVYQWIERCHFEGWWELALALTQNVPPNSLPQDYHKRLNYLLSECRTKLKAESKPQVTPKRRYIRKTGIHIPDHRYHSNNVGFESRSGETLRQIYSVLFYMKRYKADFPSAVKSTMNTLGVKDYQTVCDKCARRFAGTADHFRLLYESGQILRELDKKFGLSPNDYMLFKDILDGKKKYGIG